MAALDGFIPTLPLDEEPSDIARGAYQAGHQLVGSAQGLIGLGGALTGVDAVKQWGLEHAQARFDKADEYSRPGDDVMNLSMDNAGTFLRHGVGYVAAQALPAIISGGLGSFLGQRAAQVGIKVAAQEATMALLESGATQAEVKHAVANAIAPLVEKAAGRGALAGAGLSSYVQEAGSIYPEQVKGGHDNPWFAAGMAVPAAALDLAGEMPVLNRFYKGVMPKGLQSSFADSADRGFFANRGIAALKNAAVEAPTEAAQSYFERIGAYQPTSGPEATGDYANSAALGALGGAVFGGMFGGTRARKPIQIHDPAQTANDLTAGQPADILNAPTDLAVPASAIGGGLQQVETRPTPQGYAIPGYQYNPVTGVHTAIPDEAPLGRNLVASALNRAEPGASYDMFARQATTTPGTQEAADPLAVLHQQYQAAQLAHEQATAAGDARGAYQAQTAMASAMQQAQALMPDQRQQDAVGAGAQQQLDAFPNAPALIVAADKPRLTLAQAQAAGLVKADPVAKERAELAAAQHQMAVLEQVGAAKYKAGKALAAKIATLQGAVNGHDSQVVRPGGGETAQGAQVQSPGATPAVDVQRQGAEGAQGGVAPAAQSNAGIPASATAQGQEVSLGALESQLDALLNQNAEQVPKRQANKIVPPPKGLPENNTAFVVHALTQKTNAPEGPYARLYEALRSWNRALARASSARSEVKQNEHYAAIAATTRGEEGSIDAVVPLLHAMETAFGTKGVDEIIRGLKDQQTPGFGENSQHTRLAAAWAAYKNGTLTAFNGITAGYDEKLRSDWREEAVNDKLREHGVSVDGKIATMLKDTGDGPARFVAKTATTPAHWEGQGSGLLNFLSDSSWQGFSTDLRAISSALYEFFAGRQGQKNKETVHKGGRLDLLPNVVVKEGKNPRGAAITGTMDTRVTKGVDVNTLTLYDHGQDKRTLLHEVAHAATQRFILGQEKASSVHPAVTQLMGLLDDLGGANKPGILKESGKAAYAKLLKESGLPAESPTRQRLEIAVKNTVGAYAAATTLRDKLKAVAEFVSYGTTNTEFQAFLNRIQAKPGRTSYELSQQNARKDSTLTAWGRLVNAVSWIINQTPWRGKVSFTAMDHFLAETAKLFEAAHADTEYNVVKGQGGVTGAVSNVEAPAQRALPLTRDINSVPKEDVAKEGLGSMTKPAFAHFLAGITGTPETVKEVMATPFIPPKLRADMVRVATEKRNAEDARTGHADGEMLYSEAPTFPGPAQSLSPEQLPTHFDSSYVKSDSLAKTAFDAFGYSRGADKLGAGVRKAAEKFHKAFPGSSVFMAYLDHEFGLPLALTKGWKKVELAAQYPAIQAKTFAHAIQNLPIEQQQQALDYLDGKIPSLPDENLQRFADGFRTSALELAHEYADVVSVKDEAAREALKTKLASAKFSDLLIYIKDPSKTRGNTMSTAPIEGFMSGVTHSELRDQVTGLDADPKGRFFQLVDRTTGTGAGVVHESLASTFDTSTTIMPDRTHAWFFKGNDPSTKGAVLFERSLSYKDVAQSNKAATHAAAIQNTVAHMDRVVSSARMAQQTIEHGATAGLVFNTRAEVEAAAPHIVGTDIRTIGEARSAGVKEQAMLRRSDQWIEVPADSKAFGAMAGKFINGSVWAALEDIHHNQPAINSPTFNLIHRVFKKNKTIWSPGTHIVNIGSNVGWAYLHDIPMHAVKDGIILYVKAMTRPGALTPKERAMWAAFERSGALIADYSSAELRGILADAAMATLNTKNSSLWGMTSAMAAYEAAKGSALVKFASKADDVAQQIYAGEDNAFRLAAFMSSAAGMEQTLGRPLINDELYSAGADAATQFLDYSIHARGVNLAKQTIIPFISWPYRALPAIAKIALYKPWKLAGIMGAMAVLDAIAVSMSGGDDEDKRKRKKLPNYMNDRLFSFGPHMYVQIPGMGTNDKPVYFKFGAFVPTGDLIQNDARNGFMGLPWFPSQFTPNGPIVSSILGTVGGIDPFTGQKLDSTTDSAWDKFRKRAEFLEGQLAPPILDVKRDKDFWDKAVNGKHGPLGHEYDTQIEAMKMLGLRFQQVDIPEAASRQAKAVKAIERDYKTEISKITKESLLYPNRDPAALREKRESLMLRMKDQIAHVKNIED